MGLFCDKLRTFNPTCLIKCFLWSLLLILQGCCPFPGSDGSCAKGHYRPKIEKNTTLYNLRMEMIRQDLVEKMGLQEARPKDTPPSHIPEAILKEFWEETERYDERERTESSRQVKKLMVHAKKVTDPNCHGCVRFSSTSNGDNTNISYLNLWVFQEVKAKESTKKLSVSVFLLKEISKELILRRDISGAKPGWVNFKVVDIERWIASQDDGGFKVDLLLQFSCTHCRIIFQDDKLPLLDITKEIVVKRRNRRSVQCSGRNTECCLDKFYVEFMDFMRDLGSLILMPKGLNIGHCRGSCDTGKMHAKEHAAIVHAAKSKTTDGMQLCCAPLKYKPATVLIHDEKGDAIIKKDIYDLVVVECGCA